MKRSTLVIVLLLALGSSATTGSDGIHTKTLENGLRVVLQPQHTAPVVALAVWVAVGSADERPGEWGLAHVHEHMLFKGTPRRGVGEIARTIETAGGEINAWTGPDYTVYHAQISTRYFETALDVLADALQHSCFDKDELARELEVIHEEFKRSEDTPSHVAQELLFKIAYESHPYGRPVIGDVETVMGLERADVRTFFERWYRPAHMTLVIVGDVDVDRARGLIASHFDAPHAARIERPSRATEPEQDGLRWASEVAEIRENHVQIAFPTPALAGETLEEVTALSVLSTALGGSETSRLYAKLCRERGIVNSIGASVYAPSDPGLFILSTTYLGDTPEALEEVVEALFDETFGACGELLDDEELERARILLTSQAVYEKQTVEGQAHKLGFYHSVLEDPSLESRYYEVLEALDTATVRRVARKYLTPQRATVVVVGERATAEALTRDEVEAIAQRCYRRHEAPPRLASAVDSRGIVSARLSSGLRVILQRDPSVPLISLRAAVPGGKRYETQAQAGVSGLIGGLLTRGTTSRSALDFAAAVERLAGGFGGYAGNNAMGLSGTFLSRDLGAGLRLFAEALWRPSFPEVEFERERELILEDILAVEDDLPGEAFKRLAAEMYGEHPYGRPSLGTAESIGSLTIESLRAFYQQRVRPEQMVVALVGDLDPDETIRHLERYFEPSSDAHASELIWPEPTGPKTLKLVQRVAPKQQGHIAIGFMGVPIGHADRPALDLLAAILSGQGGRLFLELRDRESLAYSVTAFNRPELDPGYFACYIATSPDKLQRALDGMHRELKKLRDEPISDAELQRAKQFISGSFDISLQRASTRAAMMALHTLYGLAYDHHFSHAERLLAVDSASLTDAARRYLSLDRAIVSVVHPGVEDHPWTWG